MTATTTIYLFPLSSVLHIYSCIMLMCNKGLLILSSSYLHFFNTFKYLQQLHTQQLSTYILKAFMRQIEIVFILLPIMMDKVDYKESLMRSSELTPTAITSDTTTTVYSTLVPTVYSTQTFGSLCSVYGLAEYSFLYWLKYRSLRGAEQLNQGIECSGVA